MRTITTRRQRRMLGVPGAIIGGALTLGFVTPALAVDAPVEPADTQAAGIASTTFTPDLQTDIFIADQSMPNDFVASPDGLTGYVTSRELSEFTVVDLESRAVSARIPTPGMGGDRIRLSLDGTRAYFTILQNGFSSGLGVIDLTTHDVIAEFTDVPRSIQEIVVSRDGRSLYVLGLDGHVVRLDPTTGEELASARFPGMNAHGLLLLSDDSQLLVGIENKVYTLDADDLSQLNVATFSGIKAVSSFRIDSTEERVYFTDTAGSALGVFNPGTGSEISRVAVGNPMHEIVGNDALNRAFGNVPYWDKIMAADFTSGKRSESFRATPTAPFSMNLNPTTGALLSANGGWTNGARGSTVSIVNPPSVTDPADVAITAPDETVRFETNAVGIKRGHGGGVFWQASADGESWTDIEGATDEQLDVVATNEARQLQYRVRWADDFWGQDGASAPASIVAPAPAITFDGPLTDGTVDEAYPETIITATGQDDLAWSLADTDAAVSGLPDGLSLDATTGTLSGTPEVTGTFEFTVRVTDVFGEDSRAYELTILEADTPTDPVAPTDPEDPTSPVDPPGPVSPTDPANPGDPSNPADPSGDTGGVLSETGGVSPLLLGTLAAGVLAAGLSALVIARKRGKAQPSYE